MLMRGLNQQELLDLVLMASPFEPNQKCSGASRRAASGSEASYLRELSLRLREASARAWSRHLNQREMRSSARSHHVGGGGRAGYELMNTAFPSPLNPALTILSSVNHSLTYAGTGLIMNSPESSMSSYWI